LPTSFDNGSATYVVWSKRLPPVGSSDDTYFIAFGTEVSISDCANTPFLTFSADNDLNPVEVIRAGQPFGIAAIGVFYNLIVTYNVDSGVVNITPSPSAFEETGGT
jgi:hypothetical protein